MVIADTGFWLALANRRDRFHERAAEVLETLDEGLVLTWPVLTETCYLLVHRLGVEAAERLLRSHEQGAFVVVDPAIHPLSRVEALLRKYQDLPMDLADATLVLLAEHLEHGRILSTDQRDFRAYRWKSRRPFQNLLIA